MNVLLYLGSLVVLVVVVGFGLNAYITAATVALRDAEAEELRRTRKRAG